jgi:hypothetical protein
MEWKALFNGGNETPTPRQGRRRKGEGFLEEVTFKKAIHLDS